MTTINATVTAIGPSALDAEDRLIILFDESATSALRDVTVIQQFADRKAQAAMTLKAGDSIQIDAARYEIAYVGELANANIQTIGHVALLFEPVPDQPMANALYLTPRDKPVIQVGSQITYQPVEA